jgi:hypothetical protein
VASLRYSQIRAHPDGTIHYISNQEKMLSARVHDVGNVLNYMGEAESAERVYAFARNCSANPVLAAKQMELYRARYYQSSNRSAKENELLGLHFFLSYTEEDDPSEETMNYITAKLAEHPLLKDFPMFGANHFDKAHKHSHFYISQYSAEGKPRKMCMRYDDYNDLRKYANRLCVEQGLSIIDLAALRHNDPEYSAWIDGVIAEGKVAVHPEREEHKGANRQKATTRQIYYGHMKMQAEFNAEQERLMTAEQLSKNRAKQMYFWNFCKPDEPPRYYPAFGHKNKYYCVGRYDEHGMKRTLLELVVMLAIVIYRNETNYAEKNNPPVAAVIHARVDHRIQGMMDCVRTAREMHIENPEELPARIADCGRQMNALKQEKARHENSIKRQEEILSAWETYRRIRPLVEGVDAPEPAHQEAYKRAYAILAKNQILTEDAFAELRSRYLFEKRKVLDYTKRMPELNRQYRDLKRLEALACRPRETVQEIYALSRNATLAHSDNLDELVQSAEKKKIAKSSEKTNKNKSRSM